MLWVFVIVTLVTFCVYKFKKTFSYWSERGVPYLLPESYLQHFGLRSKKAFVEVLRDMVLQSPDGRYIGVYNFGIPMLMIKDPDLIKRVGVKDFETFSDHMSFVPEDIDPLWAKNLFSSTGERWRKLRPMISPAFTSSKMRILFVLIDECAREFVKFYREKNEDILELELRDAISRYANDLIASTAFGLKCDSLRNPKNEFYLFGKEATYYDMTKILRFFIHSAWPSFARLFKIQIFSTKLRTYFKSVIEETIKIREEKNIVRADIIHLLMEVQKGQLKQEEETNASEGFASTVESEFGKSSGQEQGKLTTDDIVAQAFIFFLAGFDTSSTVGSFLFYELAVNPEIQEKLYNEICETEKGCNGKITYEALLQMNYLDMVVSEILRKWPPTAATERQANRSFTFEAKLPGEKTITFEKGTICGFFIYGIHRSPSNYPNPNLFDPERFSLENKKNINPYTYIPFGVGPRNCVGSRFALLQIKILAYHVILNFEIVPTKRSQIPLVLDPKQVVLSGRDIYFGFKKRHISGNF